MLGPFTTASRLTPIYQMSPAVLSRAACALMSMTTTTTLELELSNFVQRESISGLAKWMTNYPSKVRGFAHVTHFLYAQL